MQKRKAWGLLVAGRREVALRAREEDKRNTTGKSPGLDIGGSVGQKEGTSDLGGKKGEAGIPLARWHPNKRVGRNFSQNRPEGWGKRKKRRRCGENNRKRTHKSGEEVSWGKETEATS